MKINDIIFPVYSIVAANGIREEDGITYAITRYQEKIVDNKNLKGDTLGQRRLRVPKHLRYSLNSYIAYTVSDLVKCPKKSKLFIDSKGKVFQYNKKTFVKLIYKKVKNIEVIDNKLYCKVFGIFKPIVVPFIPKEMPRYLGLLVSDGDYILYELSDIKKDDTKRKI